MNCEDILKKFDNPYQERVFKNYLNEAKAKGFAEGYAIEVAKTEQRIYNNLINAGFPKEEMKEIVFGDQS